MNSNWPQQSVFRQKIFGYAQKRGLLTPRGAVRFAELAEIFDLAEESLRQFVQHKGRRRPHIDTLTRIASEIGVSVTLFIDAPSDPPPFFSQKQWAGLTDRERVLASTLLADAISQDLTPAEKELLFGAYQDLKARVLNLRRQCQTAPDCYTDDVSRAVRLPSR